MTNEGDKTSFQNKFTIKKESFKEVTNASTRDYYRLLSDQGSNIYWSDIMDTIVTNNGTSKTSQKVAQMNLVTGECEEPIQITFEDVSAAAFRIKKGIKKTPCERSKLSENLNMELYFKKEYLHITGSFKERGARNTLLMLPKDQKRKGVIAASAGNHALALSYHGNELGIPVTVVMPINAPIMKISACRKYKADVHVNGADIIEAKDIALRLAKANGLAYINGYDHPHILAGQGTCGLEIIEDVPDVDAVVIPVGGGGLIAGMAVAIKSLNPDIQIIGVESERCASFQAALEAGHPVKIDAIQSATLADGLCVSKVGDNAFATAKPYVDKVISVSEDFIALAILRLLEEEKAVVEGAGVTAFAALVAGLLPELEGKKVVVPLCGGNIDSTVLGRCIDRGLAADGRLCRFIVTVSDRPGGIAELTRLLSSIGASVKDIYHERAWLTSSVFSVQIKVVAEVRDREHSLEVKQALQLHYPENVMWGEDYHYTSSTNKQELIS
ncbi:uncharacterized protein LOC116298014 [Actinia tenebrosa]|uniref:Serine racemase n=1 Tax=Actinia tenebrosa TaxID=6105 RepID=A0A6P8I422_ACTTE|nr:uncharacterized protein LOC116298014 [Actinia tenebrosa]